MEATAGIGSGFPDDAYAQAGAKLLKKAENVWDRADMVLKVKEPIGPEFAYIKPGQVLFTYLHLAAGKELTENILARKIVGIGYETVQLQDGSLPLLAPMSEVAGALSVQMGASCLEANNGGMGILLSGVGGVRPARVTVIGAGVAGLAAATVASGIGARVSILDINPVRLSYIRDVMQGRVVTVNSNPANIEEECLASDLVIGTVLIPGAKAPKLISRDLIRRMKKGSAIVDISIDQGGCTETSRPTTHENPIYIEEGVVHYCVANMPGARRAIELARSLEKQSELDKLKSEFVQNVSHELRTPLAIIRGYAELLKDGELVQLTDEQMNGINVIARRSIILSKMLDDLLVILSAETGKMDHTPVDMVSLARTTLIDFDVQAKQAKLNLSSRIQMPLAPIYGDAAHLRRVLDNLLGNALKFTPAGGEVSLALYDLDSNVILEVSDTGAGIAPEHLDRIFERFYQLDGSTTRRHAGVGLGLALVKEIAVAHGGNVEVAITMDMGTTFRVSLPMMQSPPASDTL